MERTLIENALKNALPLFDAGRHTGQQAARLLREFAGNGSAATAVEARVKEVLVDEQLKMEVIYA